MLILLCSVLWLIVIFNFAGYFFASAGIQRLMNDAGMKHAGRAYIPLYRLWLLGKLTGNERYLPGAFLVCGGYPLLMVCLFVLSLALLVTVLLAPIALVLMLLMVLILPVMLYACPIFFYILLYRFFKTHCENSSVLFTVLAVIFAHLGVWQYLIYFTALRNFESRRKSGDIYGEQRYPEGGNEREDCEKQPS